MSSRRIVADCCSYLKIAEFSYNFGYNPLSVLKEASRYSLKSNGLTSSYQWRERRVVLGTNGKARCELPDELLRAFKDWCTSPEMQVMSASYMAVLSPN